MEAMRCQREAMKSRAKMESREICFNGERLIIKGIQSER